MRLQRWMVSLRSLAVATVGILAFMLALGAATFVSQDDRASELTAEISKPPRGAEARFQGLAVWKHEVLQSTNQFLEICGVQDAVMRPRPAVTIVAGGVS